MRFSFGGQGECTGRGTTSSTWIASGSSTGKRGRHVAGAAPASWISAVAHVVPRPELMSRDINMFPAPVVMRVLTIRAPPVVLECRLGDRGAHSRELWLS